MKPLLLLLMCASAYAAPLPPAVPRPSKLLSPRHASQPKAAPMFRPASVIPPLPMKWAFRKVTNEYGDFEFTAQSFKPVNTSLLFEVSQTVKPQTWEFFAFFDAERYPTDVFAALYSSTTARFVRVTPTTVIPTRAAAVFAPVVAVNPQFLGARAWKVKR